MKTMNRPHRLVQQKALISSRAVKACSACWVVCHQFDLFRNVCLDICLSSCCVWAACGICSLSGRRLDAFVWDGCAHRVIRNSKCGAETDVAIRMKILTADNNVEEAILLADGIDDWENVLGLDWESTVVIPNHASQCYKAAW